MAGERDTPDHEAPSRGALRVPRTERGPRDQRPEPPRRVTATYRLQLRPGFGFAEAEALVPYFADLGISHLYLSPFLAAGEGSLHGYDVVDPSRVREDLGGEAAFRSFAGVARQAGLGLILDIVPNHMSIASADNIWWWDVLESGAASFYADYFDVEWESPWRRFGTVPAWLESDEPEPERAEIPREDDRILLPILGDQYGKVLARGDVQVRREGAQVLVEVPGRLLPASPRSLVPLLRAATERCASEQLAFWADVLEDLPSRRGSDPITRRRRARALAMVRRGLTELFQQDVGTARAVDAELAALTEDLDQLDEFLRAQTYRIAYWRLARRDLDYRRFFDIDTLAAIRIGEPEVFAAMHDLPLQWYAEGLVDGFRVDHPDGLRDPAGYFERLRSAAPDGFIVVEKILEPGEALPPWPVDGTTGYDAMHHIDAVFVAQDAAPRFDQVYEDHVGAPLPDWDALRLRCKRQALRELLGSDLRRLSRLFAVLCEGDRAHRDHGRRELEAALEAALVQVPVYRTYVRAQRAPRPADEAILAASFSAAREDRPNLDPELFRFLERLFSDPTRGDVADELVARFQQLSGPAMAKGVEDTAFYRYHRLVALCEVGGDPAHFGQPVARLHEVFAEVADRWPRTLIAGSTHDTKRSEDARIRLFMATHDPGRWARFVQDAGAVLAAHRDPRIEPDPATEYLALQTLVASWPISPERLWRYLEKAVREAKERTHWTSQDAEYEAALRHQVETALAGDKLPRIVDEYVGALLPAARRASLAHLLLRLTLPGVPDVYQGAELFLDTLTDPDNRDIVDHALRRVRLEALGEAPSPEEVLSAMDEGLPKLWVLREALRLRRARPAWFGPEAGYAPLPVEGPHAPHVVAFVRGAIATVVPVAPSVIDDRETYVDLGSVPRRDVFTGDVHVGHVSVAALFARFPVALLVPKDAA